VNGEPRQEGNTDEMIWGVFLSFFQIGFGVLGVVGGLVFEHGEDEVAAVMAIKATTVGVLHPLAGGPPRRGGSLLPLLENSLHT